MDPSGRRFGHVVEVMECECKCVAVEGWFSGEHVIRESAKRVEIAARVRSLATALLRRHVARAPHYVPGGSEIRLLRELRETEIDHADRSIWLDEQVLGLEIAMCDAGSMRSIDRRGDLLEQRLGLVQWQRAALVDDRSKRAPLQALHDAVRAAIGECAEVVDAHDTGMIDSAGGPRLGDEARDRGCITAVRCV
ncbi:MAG: hypothetical protein ABI867_18150 [Kofleriaceae bacterium]